MGVAAFDETRALGMFRHMGFYFYLADLVGLTAGGARNAHGLSLSYGPHNFLR